MILCMIPMSRTQNCVKKHHSPAGILRIQHFKSHTTGGNLSPEVLCDKCPPETT